MAFDPNSTNLAVWNREEKTDPKFTKPITGKAFRGTALNGTYVMKRLTDAFGPVGWGWGYHASYEDVHFPHGASLNFCMIEFYYYPFGRLDADERRIATFSQVGGTELSGHRKDGKPFADDEARKKSLTDALLKAASHIGIGGDIHLGLFDDSKYVDERSAESASAQNTVDQAATTADKGRVIDLAAALVAEINAAATESALAALRAKALTLKPELTKHGLKDNEKAIGGAIQAALARLTPANSNKAA